MIFYCACYLTLKSKDKIHHLFILTGKNGQFYPAQWQENRNKGRIRGATLIRIHSYIRRVYQRKSTTRSIRQSVHMKWSFFNSSSSVSAKLALVESVKSTWYLRSSHRHHHHGTSFGLGGLVRPANPWTFPHLIQPPETLELRERKRRKQEMHEERKEIRHSSLQVLFHCSLWLYMV